MSSRSNTSRNPRTAQTPANADAAADETPAVQTPDTDAPQTDAAPEPTPDVQPDVTDPAPSTTESDEPVTESTPTPETAPARTPDQMFAEMLATATSATVPLDASSAPRDYAGMTKVEAFAVAIVIARDQTLRTLAARSDDEIVRTVTLSARPDSASGRGPTLAIVQGYIAQALGGAGFVSIGNCHDSTKARPIYGHVVLPEVVVPLWDAIWTAMDAPAGPIRTAEAATKQVNRAGMKAGTVAFSTLYQAENKRPRLNMLATIANIMSLVPAVPADDEERVTAMRDVIAAVTAELARVTSVGLLPRGPKYLVTPDDRYAVKQELVAAAASPSGFTQAGDPVVASA